MSYGRKEVTLAWSIVFEMLRPSGTRTDTVFDDELDAALTLIQNELVHKLDQQESLAKATAKP